MKKLLFISLLLSAGCTQWGFIGEAGSTDVDGILMTHLELAGATTATRTVVASDRSDDDGVDDQAWRFAWTLADCHDADCLPADLGEARQHVFRIRATDGAGEHVYKKVTVTLFP